MSGMYIGDEYERDYCVLLDGVLTFFIDTLEGESAVLVCTVRGRIAIGTL